MRTTCLTLALTGILTACQGFSPTIDMMTTDSATADMTTVTSDVDLACLVPCDATGQCRGMADWFCPAPATCCLPKEDGGISD